jgi:hypothetical protein
VSDSRAVAELRDGHVEHLRGIDVVFDDEHAEAARHRDGRSGRYRLRVNRRRRRQMNIDFG